MNAEGEDGLRDEKANVTVMDLKAPLAVFVHKRLTHTQRTLQALAANELAERADLIVFSDGAKSDGDPTLVAEVREFVRSVTGFRSVKVVERERNLGLAQSIISGVSEVLESHESVIVVEDDLVTSPYFLQYMNDALNRYCHDDRVASIHGYVYPVREKLPETFFLRGADCWGWATWRRAWKLFNPDGRSLLRELEERNLTFAFDFGGAYPYTQMLRDQIAGRNDSWAIRWYASTFLANALTLYPGRSLVQNIGVDGSGTHCGTSTSFETQTSEIPVDVTQVLVEDSLTARSAISQFLSGGSPISPPQGKLTRIARRMGWLRSKEH